MPLQMRRSLGQLTHTADTLRIRAKTLVGTISIPHPPSKLTLRLSRRTLRIAWLVILVFHLFNAMYSMSLAYLYHFMAKPSMSYYVHLIQLMPQDNYTIIIALYASISALNIYSALTMIVYTLYYRQVVFSRVSKPRTTDILPSMTGEIIVNTSTVSHCGRVSRAFSSVVESLSSVARAFSVRGALFDTMLLIREMVEIASQTKQAHSSSLLVSKIWMNQLFAALIFLNTIANTAVNRLREDKVGMRRFLCSVIDLFLDFIWGFILPANIIFNYIPMFIANHLSLPPSFSYSDTLMTKATLECKQFFMISWTDAITTTIPYLNMLMGLRNVKILLQNDAEEQLRAAFAARQPSRQQLELLPSPITENGPTMPRGSPKKVLPTIATPERDEKKMRPWFAYVVIGLHCLMPLCGLFVLLTSISATGLFFGDSDVCGHGCKLRMHPWFTSKCACSVLEINCYRRNIEGNEAEIGQILQSLDARVLNSLMITHCPALVVPPEIRRFKNLMALEFHNDTFVDWSKSASLSLPYTPSLGYVYIARSTLPNGLPHGLTTDLAPNIIDIEISATNIGKPLPDDLHDKWPSVLLLYIEHCGLQEFPPVLAKMATTDLSLVGNNISLIPEDLPQGHDWMYLLLDHNPLINLPENFGSVRNLFFMSIQLTNITSLPAGLWEKVEDGLFFLGYGTPLCENAVDDIASLMHCSLLYPGASDGVYPLAMKDALRQP